MTHVLAGDIGGTRARFAIFEVGGEAGGTNARLVHQDTLESGAYRTFEACLKDFLDRGRLSVTAASMGIAGPVVDQRVKTTNLPWTIDAKTIAKKFQIQKVTLLNDLVAAGLGAIASPSKKVVSIHKGRPKTTGGNLAVIAAGTGLGEAMFIWDGSEHIACATEGGHTDFAPRTTVEDELLSYLRAEHGRVSYERVASGSTISVVYRFFVKEQKVKETKEAAAKIASADDPNVAIVDLAVAGKSEAAMRAVDLWCSVYGSEAGNLALKALSTAGVFLCGGVSAALAEVLTNGLPKRKKKGPSPFVEAFLDKGRLRPVVESIPVAVCTEPKAGLLGAATHAMSAAAPATKKRARSARA